MSRHWGQAFSYHTGCGGEGGKAAGVLTAAPLAEQKIDHALVGVWDGAAWAPGQPLAWAVAGICRVSWPWPAWVAVGTTGRALVVDERGAREEAMGEGEDAAGRVGLLRAARAIGGRAYGVGMCRQVYRRDDDGLWSRADRGCRRPAGDTGVVGFEAVDGFGGDDLYAVGWRGEVWHGDGEGWRRLDSPTNVILTNICCAGDGSVYACGRRGMLLRGRGDRWEAVDHGGTEEDFWGIAWHDGRLYVSTFHGVAVLDGDELSWVDGDDADLGSCYHLSAADGRLWSFGPREVAVLDGAVWRPFD